MKHIDQIQRAVDYIESHLTEELPFDSIAREAGFSMWHFQRIFCSSVGDTLKTYIRQRRLSAALLEIGSTDRRLLDIALDYQFESQESFSRAFKTLYGKSPGECRSDGAKELMARIKPRITMDYLTHLAGGLTMQPSFITANERKIIGVDGKFISIHSPDKNNHIVIPALWKSFMPRLNEVTQKKRAVPIGVCEVASDPKLKMHPDECHYWAGVEVTNFELVPKGMVGKTIPAGRYAVFTHKGHLDNLGHTLNYIYGSWLAQSGEKLRDAPDLEIYDERFKLDSDDSEIELHIPIV